MKDVTLAIIPGERFAIATLSLRSILTTCDTNTTVVYVDVGSPDNVQREIVSLLKPFNHRLIKLNKYVHSNQARQLALEQVDTEYVVFIDNDMLVHKGWLESLVRCARTTGAGIVGPLILSGNPEDPLIHLCGAELDIVTENGQRRIHNKLIHHNKRLYDFKEPLRCQATGFVESHCVLMRTQLIQEMGGFDLEIRTGGEYLDLGLRARQHDASIYVEPQAVVCYVDMEQGEVLLSDIRYYLFRWGESDFLKSQAWMERKWDVNFSSEVIKSIRNRRREMWRRMLSQAQKRLFGKRECIHDGVNLDRAAAYVNQHLLRTP